MTWSAPATWVAGAIVTAAQMNTGVRDNLKALGDPWTAWTPVFTSSVGIPAIGNGTLTGGYIAAGKFINYWGQLVAGTTTTFGTGTFQFTLPVGESAHNWGFQGLITDTSAVATYPVVAKRASAALLQLFCDATTAGNPLRAVTNLIPFTWATTDVLFFSGTYEAS